jgi:hypothetical protein
VICASRLLAMMPYRRVSLFWHLNVLVVYTLGFQVTEAVQSLHDLHISHFDNIVAEGCSRRLLLSR